jgi:hypothetical protein
MMTGLLTRTETGIAAELSDPAGYRYRLTGAKVDGGYAVEIVVVHVPSWLALPGDSAVADAPETSKLPREPHPPGKPIPAPKPGKSKMIGEICPDCMTYHAAPTCGWDAGRPCPGCGKPIGLRTARMKGDVCFSCEQARGGQT